jgi:hypothetical protein
LLAPRDWLEGKVNALADKMAGKSGPPQMDRRAELANFYQENANPDSLAFQGGALTSQIAGTAGVGGALAGGARVIPGLAKFAPALESGGFKVTEKATTLPGKLANAAVRTGAGATVGGVSAGMVDPNQAGMGAVIGGAMPATYKVAGEAGKTIHAAGKATTNKLGIKVPQAVSDEVKTLYQKAKALGIDIPVDRIVDNRPLNAGAASLNYVPLSGRMGTENKMLSQFNRAVSRSFGQDSDNVTMALRKAGTDLGKKFDDTLQNNAVVFDNTFMDDLIKNEQIAMNELDDASANLIRKQINTILSKVGPDGKIDGQTAYNIKKTLDRIGSRKSNEAYYARELKKSLMGALNRSLGADKAAEFAKVRQQYGNMLDLEGLAQNGAEGGISVGRLANMKNINNQELQDLADIAAQFLKTREAPHGAAQRVGMLGLGAAASGAGLATGTLPLVGTTMGVGRVANTALNSSILKDALVDRPELYRNILDIASRPLVRTPAVIAGPGLLYQPK